MNLLHQGLVQPSSSILSTMSPSEPNAIPFKAVGNIPTFQEEKDGWKGYIEWEKYPDKKKQVHEILQRYDFPDVGCFSPKSNSRRGE